MSRRILVLGGNRFFGRRLVSLLLNEGCSVTVLNRGSKPDPFAGRAKLLVCDRSDEQAFRTALENQEFDVVFDQVCFNSLDALVACEVFAHLVQALSTSANISKSVT